MPRGKVSAADQLLVDALRQRGYEVSPYKLERWRTQGLMPKNIRRSLGRGRGTVSTLDADAVACAAMLSDSHADSLKIMRYVIKVLRGYYELRPRDRIIARRPTMVALHNMILMDDLLEISEDEAYEQARWFSGPEFISFSRDRIRPLSDSAADTVAHKRDMYQHYLVASYLGVDAVGEGMLRQALLDLGMASEGGVDTALAFLDTNFTSADERRKVLSSISFNDLLYYLSLAAFLVVVDPDSRHNHFQSESLRIADQLARFQELELGWVNHISSPSVEPETSFLMFLVEDKAFRDQVEYMFGDKFLSLLCERMDVIAHAVIVKPLPSEVTARREKAYSSFMAEYFLRPRKWGR